MMHVVHVLIGESVNAMVQWIESTARSFCSREGFRAAIYIYRGGLGPYSQ